MSKKKLTPIEAIERKKLYLQIKSDALVDVMETNFQYVQDNFGSLLGQATMDAIVAKLPPFLQNLIGRGQDNDQAQGIISAESLEKYDSYADYALDMVPLFVKGIKGVAITFLLKKVKDWVFKKKK